MNSATIIGVLSKFLAGVSQISENTRRMLISDAERRLNGKTLEGEDANPFKQELHFQVLRGELLDAHWEEIDPEERIHLIFPWAKNVGEEMELPRRGKAKVLWRELTVRHGLKMGFRLTDGNTFVWEFLD